MPWGRGIRWEGTCASLVCCFELREFQVLARLFSVLTMSPLSSRLFSFPFSFTEWTIYSLTALLILSVTAITAKIFFHITMR